MFAKTPDILAKNGENDPSPAITNPIPIVIGTNSNIKILANKEASEKIPKLDNRIGSAIIWAAAVVMAFSFHDKNPPEPILNAFFKDGAK